MKIKEIITAKCDICGSTKDVLTASVPMYRADWLKAKEMLDPKVYFDEIEICVECLQKATNIHDMRDENRGIAIETNSFLHDGLYKKLYEK